MDESGTTNEELEIWLHRVKNWIDLNKTDMILDIHSYMDKLSTFLHSLSHCLNLKASVADRLDAYPMVGQLLGRLSTNCFLLKDSTVYEALMNCLMNFYVENPRTTLEVKAKQWVLSQIRGTVCNSRFSTSNKLPGHSNQKYLHHICLKKVQKDISCCVHRNHRRWNAGLKCFVTSPGRPCDGEALRNLCRLCLCMGGDPFYMSLLADALRELSWCNDEHVKLEKIYRDVMESDIWNSCHNFTDQNTRAAVSKLQTSLWCLYLPALEQSLLHLVGQCVTKASIKTYREVFDIIRESNLPETCARNVQLHAACKLILKSILERGKGHCQIVTFICCFHQSILNSLASVQNCPNLVSRYPKKLKSLVRLLQVNARNLDLTSAEQHLLTITGCLGDLVQQSALTDCSDLTFCLLENLQWYHMAFILSLKASSKAVTEIVSFIQIYHCLIRSEAVTNKYSGLENVLLSLRGLLCKTRLELCDVQCVVATSDALSQDSQTPRRLIQQSLLLFILMSNSGGHILEAALPMIMLPEHQESPSLFLLQTLDMLLHQKRHDLIKHPALLTRYLKKMQETVAHAADPGEVDMTGDDVRPSDSWQHQQLVSQYTEECIKLLCSITV